MKAERQFNNAIFSFFDIAQMLKCLIDLAAY